MATYTRSNAWNKGGTFTNSDLLWYAKGVGVMMSRPLSDPNSWWFFAAIHGQTIARTKFPGWGFLPSPPQVPTTPLPTPADIKLYWDQCQHQSWYFAPWHRGYLIALEAQVRAAIQTLQGPFETWALPYWNYLGPTNQYKIPPAFMQTTLPDGTPNPLYVKARYGPKMDNNVYVEIPPVSGACMKNTVYTGSNPVTPLPGFGGRKTGFFHGGNVASGNLESNPHNLVHVDVGGANATGTVYGIMSDPPTAALDPIFYLHHSNIDRMWAAWNNAGNSNPVDPAWLKGPAGSGQRPFVVPMPGSVAWTYTPGDVNSLSQLNYTYDDLTTGVTPVEGATRLNRRLMKLGASPDVLGTPEGEDMDTEDKAELVGANEGEPLEITSAGARTDVRLDSTVNDKVRSTLRRAAADALPDQVYLELQNVRGNVDAYKLTVSVNDQNAGTVGLFGLRNATEEDGEHGGGGLTFLFDITNIVDNLFLDNGLDISTLDVRITPNRAVIGEAELSVGRVSVYRVPQQ